VKSKHRIRAGDQLRLERPECGNSLLQIHAGPRCGPSRQPQVNPVMPGLSLMQAAEQIAQGSTDGLPQRRETLAGSRFNERAANHQIDLTLRLAR